MPWCMTVSLVISKRVNVFLRSRCFGHKSIMKSFVFFLEDSPKNRGARLTKVPGVSTAELTAESALASPRIALPLLNEMHLEAAGSQKKGRGVNLSPSPRNPTFCFSLLCQRARAVCSLHLRLSTRAALHKFSARSGRPPPRAQPLKRLAHGEPNGRHAARVPWSS